MYACCDQVLSGQGVCSHVEYRGSVMGLSECVQTNISQFLILLCFFLLLSGFCFLRESFSYPCIFICHDSSALQFIEHTTWNMQLIKLRVFCMLGKHPQRELHFHHKGILSIFLVPWELVTQSFSITDLRLLQC